MRIKPAIFLFLFSLVGYQSNAQTQTQQSGNVYLAKLLNGLNGLMLPVNSAASTEITLYIKTGTVFDNDSLSGISGIVQKVFANKISLALQRRGGTLTLQNTGFTSYLSSERTAFRLNCNDATIVSCLTLLRDSIFYAGISEAEVNEAIAQTLKEIDSVQHNPRSVLWEKIVKNVFPQDTDKLITYGNPAKFPFINREVIWDFYKKYYVSNNTIITITGNILIAPTQSILETVFVPLIRSEFDPETITKIVDFHPMIYSKQFIVNVDSVQPEFNIVWQFPGTYADQRASYCAFLTAAILNDKNNYIQVKAAKMGCKKFTALYEANSFSGFFRIVLQPDNKNLFSTLQFVMGEIDKLSNTLVNESMVTAAKLIFKKDYENIKKGKDYADWIVKYWPYNDEGYFISLQDSLMGVSEKEMKRFAFEHIYQGAHVRALMISESDRKELKVDSVFTDIDENVKDYVFTYRQNITDIEGEDNFIKRKNLFQWLDLNKDVYVKINGYADEGEFNKAFDDSIMTFIDSVPTFRKTMPEAIKKGYLRPEMMRVMKLIKFLYEAGIEDYRLSGTSIRFHSEDKKEAQGNMKCTVVLDKLRKNMPQYQHQSIKK